jgi:hypothetical protein
MSSTLLRSLKHFPGWRTNTKYVAFAADDYGSIRTANAKAVIYLRQRNAYFGGQMDEFDSVETRADLEALFDVLSKHSDFSGRTAEFTAYFLTANPDCKFIMRNRHYAYETLTQTYERLAAEEPAAYEGTWKMLSEGFSNRLVTPQFHGREHFSVPLIEEKIRLSSKDLFAALEVGSMAGLTNLAQLPSVTFTQAFGLHDIKLLDNQRDIIQEGLELFEETFGFPSITFTPPVLKLHQSLDKFVFSLGVKSIHKPLFGSQPLGNGRMRRSVNFLSPSQRERPGKLVRTLSFEPCNGKKSDPVGQALLEMEVAFRWGKPAIISTHRVNYAGHINSDNRKRGLEKLDQFLQRMLEKWPDIRFVTVNELVEIMEASKI